MVNTESRRAQIDLVLNESFAPGLSYQGLHIRYAESIFGQHHATQPPRYSQQYGYESDQMIKDLGDDVHPVRHMSYTENRVARPFIASQVWGGYERLSSNEIIGLRLAALLHDIGESEHPAIAEALGSTVGDVFYETKQVSDAQQEILIRQFLYRELYSDVPMARLEQAEKAIEQPDSFSGLAFNTIERIGYFKTAIKAGELALFLSRAEAETARSSIRCINLARLALRVSDNHRAVLQERAEIFPYAGYSLRSDARTDERMHTDLPEFVQRISVETA